MIVNLKKDIRHPLSRHSFLAQVRDVQGELVRAVLHQLRQREAAAAVLQPRVQAGAGRVREGGHRVEVHHLHRQPALHRPHRGQDGHTGPAERPVQGCYSFKLSRICRKT